MTSDEWIDLVLHNVDPSKHDEVMEARKKGYGILILAPGSKIVESNMDNIAIFTKRNDVDRKAKGIEMTGCRFNGCIFERDVDVRLDAVSDELDDIFSGSKGS